MTPAEAEDLAARALAAIDALDYSRLRADIDAADRERVASDLVGLRDHDDGCFGCMQKDCPDHVRYAAGLRRTAALYGVSL